MLFKKADFSAPEGWMKLNEWAELQFRRNDFVRIGLQDDVSLCDISEGDI